MYQAGWGRQEIGVSPRGYAMYGYGQPGHRALGQETPLYARAFFVQDAAGQALTFCCLDLGYVSYAMRAGAIERLRERMGAVFNDAAFVLTCTHTHSGPGGCSHDVMYNLVTPGFVPEHLEAIISATVDAVLAAWQSAAPTDLNLASGRFDEAVPVAWNRSLKAWNRNPDVTRYQEGENHKALERTMQVLSFSRDGQMHSLLSLFGVHATCLGNSLDRHDGDNKGYASAQVEQQLADVDAVAIFAQGTAGDVSPHYHGPRQTARRNAIKGRAEYVYAAENGRYQSDMALNIAADPQQATVNGGIDAIFTYVDFTAVHADPAMANGEPEAWTTDPCHGVSFFAGTPVDGHGVPPPLASVMRIGARVVRNYRLGPMSRLSPEERQYYQRLYSAQGSKDIFMETGRKLVLGRTFDRLGLPDAADPLMAEMKRQAKAGAINESAMVPTVLPLQIVILGQIALVSCPGEFTTIAGRRLLKVVAERLRPRGIEQVLICTYCNDYMGYVTTNEEYQEQAYEGGHTMFGQWTLAAFQTGFVSLAEELLKPESERMHDRVTQPKPAPVAELMLRSSLPPRS
ncbi:MAG: neutral/alkaline non-lysosomal ceramidase N-terminal domain-containing protein [Moraxellaceae bacterium]|nr:neutral/alkaline non-lysosomal ceramidase N-terminal domain-containing protein [Moraxellaceae bacterium]MDZ4387374.1 neutral/alkaline non-lysosomal ceramidase N-terminal domain-containing protein [Moraxellaceae bacterium]